MIDRDALIDVLDSIHEGITSLHWAEADRMNEALGWTNPLDGPDGTWIRARLNEALR